MLEDQNEDVESIGSKFIKVSKLVTSNKQKLDSTYDVRAMTAVRTRNNESSKGTHIVN
jgi:hypothetical protein